MPETQPSPPGAGNWTLDEARKHDVVDRLIERCAAYAGASCARRELPLEDWCERCLAAKRIVTLEYELHRLGAKG